MLLRCFVNASFFVFYNVKIYINAFFIYQWLVVGKLDGHDIMVSSIHLQTSKAWTHIFRCNF